MILGYYKFNLSYHIKKELVYKLDPNYIINEDNIENKEIENSEFFTHKKNEIAEKKGSITNNDNKLGFIESPTKLNELNQLTNPLVKFS
jgi:hypothetical protein